MFLLRRLFGVDTMPLTDFLAAIEREAVVLAKSDVDAALAKLNEVIAMNESYCSAFNNRCVLYPRLFHLGSGCRRSHFLSWLFSGHKCTG